MKSTSKHPRPKWNRVPALEYRNAHFKTPYNKTLDQLEYEIRKLDGREIVIEAGYQTHEIRNDGWPRAAPLAARVG